ncbi:hypothetical protein EOPP23_12550 [Endozoicomonas sp. OPT23]|uniref:VOC family protein n=1 Tax=Endozoicomonas sp. OPT23 TaxID=2072845 RepID=UPI00129A111A|nr:VOC family protein [Endozoicomonas sp. OPT23]MRI33816.1 hypothetical protein [Endozoicomonas sp. OPT23]
MAESVQKVPLAPVQVCFIVNNVEEAVRFSEEHFGWGPFHTFSAPVENAKYKDWTGFKHVDVALGSGGNVQIEYVHVREGKDTIALYEEKYGTGIQHFGVQTPDRDAAIDYITSLGGEEDARDEFPGVRFAFMNIPTGQGMFELLQPEQSANSIVDQANAVKAGGAGSEKHVLKVDRATVVTGNMEETLAFYSQCFDWVDVKAEAQTLKSGDREVKLKRCIAFAGAMEIELIEATPEGTDPYSLHRRRGEHGIVHVSTSVAPVSEALLPSYEGEWLETGEAFALYEWLGGNNSLQVRR